ncbi:hypothetical protein Gbth_132_003 [Gluconobacter thailandicus F149-1 = NBRC 100600]|nr:hypothetical protein Gbth_132_003 [Gluconobacter thailandicus F149-1 = NBRC 100600]GEL88370.1 hypothetical protein GTH01_27280 [Gluconobacter thailandicus F149-1 = NBRC 100600]
MRDPERKGGFDGLEEVDGVLGVMDRQMHRSGAPVDGDIQISLPPFSVRRLKFRQMLHIDMDVTRVVVPEGSFPTNGSGFRSERKPVQPRTFQNAPDAVPVQMQQEMPHDECQVVQAKPG